MPDPRPATIDWSHLHAELARPFPDALVKYRVGAISRDKTKAQALPYVDPRAYEDRLNELVPDAWGVEFEPWGGSRIICRLTIHGMTRSSTGDGAGSPDAVAGTAAEAQAFKRACSKFGLGRYLYELPAAWVPYDAEKKALRGASVQATPRPRADSAPKQTPATTVTPVLLLGRARAATMHRELARLGLARSEHQALAQRVLRRPVDDFATLTEAEARTIWTLARTRHPNAVPYTSNGQRSGESPHTSTAS